MACGDGAVSASGISGCLTDLAQANIQHRWFVRLQSFDTRSDFGVALKAVATVGWARTFSPHQLELSPIISSH